MNRSARAARYPAWGRALAGVCGLVLCLARPAAAQYTDPFTTVPTVPTTTTAPTTGTHQMFGVGSVHALGTTGFRLTSSFPWQRGAAWLVNKQFVASGFQTTFQFRISGLSPVIDFTGQRGADGFAFVIQNFSIPVVGHPAGFLGYHGIPNSLAVEFDTWWNRELGFFDPNGNHISVHTRGLAGNSVSESFSLGRTTAIPFLKDGAIHTVRIVYTPGILDVYIDNLAAPVLRVGVNLSQIMQLDAGRAWFGFTAATGSAYATHDIVSWQLGQVTTTVPDGGTVPVTVEGPFPVNPIPTTPTPTSPTQPFVLPPAPNTGTTPVTSETPLTFPPYQ